MGKIVKITVEIINGEESNVLNISSPMNSAKDEANTIDNILDKVTSFISRNVEQKNTSRCSRQQYEPVGDLSRKVQTLYGGFSFNFAEAKNIIKRRNLREHLGFPFTVNRPITKAIYKESINLLRLSANSIIGSRTAINLLDAKDIDISLSLDLPLGTHMPDLDKLIKLSSSEQSALISYLLNCSKLVDVDAIEKITQEGIYASKKDINILMDKVLPFRMAEIHKALSEAKRVDSKSDFDGELVNTHSYALMNPELPNKEDNTIVEKLIKYPIAPIDFSIFDSDSELPAFILNHANFESVHSLVLISDKNILNDINEDTAFFLITDVKKNINKYFNLYEKENFGTYFNIPKNNSAANDINEYLSNRKNVYISEYAILRIMEHYDISYSELRNEILDYDETPINIEEMKSTIKHLPLTNEEINSLLEAATECNKKNDIGKIKISAGNVSISLSDKVAYIYLVGSINSNRFTESVYTFSDLLELPIFKFINPENLMLVEGYKDKSFSYPVLILNHMASSLASLNIDKDISFSKILIVGESEDEFVEIGKNEIIYYQEISAPFQNAVLTSQRIFGDVLKEQPIKDFICVKGWYAKDSNKKAVALRSIFKQIEGCSRSLDLAIKEIKLKEEK